MQKILYDDIIISKIDGEQHTVIKIETDVEHRKAEEIVKQLNKILPKRFFAATTLRNNFTLGYSYPYRI